MKLRLVYCLFIVVIVVGCSRKHVPQEETAKKEDDKETTKKADSVAAVKRAMVKRITVLPKVIVVNDKAAKKSVDGRLYYDLNGHRYWRNNKDGKYYLFNQSMYTDKAFKPQ